MSATITSPDDAPFPLGSVQAVASRAWALCLREDPVGLLAMPFLIYFPVYVFLTILSELIRDPEVFTRETTLVGAVVGVLPLVIFARVFGESWILVRADAEAHGRRISYTATLSHAFTRSWYLIVVMLAVYALVQLGLFLFIIPGLIVWVIASFANQAAVLGPGRLMASLRLSRDLLEHNVAAWCGMIAYWIVVFLGMGMLVGILRQSLASLIGGAPIFLVDLALGLPLQIALLVFTACWTLFYRELEARRHQHLRLSPAAPAPPPMSDVSARAS